MESLNEILELDYVKQTNYTLNDSVKSVCQIEMKSGTNEKYLIMSRIIGEKNQYCTLITEFFTLSYNGTTLSVTDSDGVMLDNIDPSITEEWFFQQSCVKNYNAIEHEDITFLTDVYNILVRK
ncbi:hypothetical protein pEaSNUABM49_00370 [Erwinia phage pEa_SNUABM_49]|nr:hypothetical protein pEaSNUABM49_00370 [Erwinia phage pEa_SNUABM_49]